MYLADDNLHIVTKELKNLSSKERNELLEKLRTEVDKIDSEISSLLIERIKLIMEIGEIKRTLNLPAYDAAREREIENNIRFNGNPEINKALKNIFERIVDESRSIQRGRKK